MRVFLLSVVLAFQCLQTADFYNGNQIFFSAACPADFLCLHSADFYSRSIPGRLFSFSVIKKVPLQA
jgi:hypothetical protein